MKKLIVVILMSVSSLFAFEFGNKQNEFELKNVEELIENQIPIVKLKINNKDYVFLVDTSCPNSILDSKSARDKNVEIHKEYPIDSTIIDVKDYALLLNTKFCLKKFDTAKSNVYYHTGQKIDGVIGKDVLQNNTINIKGSLIKDLNNK